MKRKYENVTVTNYWYKNYLNKNAGAGGLCGLCGNSGVIDTRSTATSPMGIQAGGVHWCICPNGQCSRFHAKKNKITPESHLAMVR